MIVYLLHGKEQLVFWVGVYSISNTTLRFSLDKLVIPIVFSVEKGIHADWRKKYADILVTNVIYGREGLQNWICVKSLP